MDEINKIPPVTRFLCGSTLAVTLPTMLQVVSPYKLVFVKDLVIKGFQLWRPFTSLFFAGSGINFIFDFAMLYRNSDSLESAQFAGRSADYAWQLLINAISILALNMPLKSFLHFRPLLLSLITLSSRLSPNSVVSIFGLFSLSNSYFPFAMLAMDLVMGGPSAAASSVTGIISGYLWWYLVYSDEAGRPGAEFANAPAWLHRLVGGNTPVTQTVSGAAGSAAGAANRAVNRATGGYSWGSGQRLGTSS